MPKKCSLSDIQHCQWLTVNVTFNAVHSKQRKTASFQTLECRQLRVTNILQIKLSGAKTCAVHTPVQPKNAKGVKKN